MRASSVNKSQAVLAPVMCASSVNKPQAVLALVQTSCFLAEVACLECGVCTHNQGVPGVVHTLAPFMARLRFGTVYASTRC